MQPNKRSAIIKVLYCCEDPDECHKVPGRSLKKQALQTTSQNFIQQINKDARRWKKKHPSHMALKVLRGGASLHSSYADKMCENRIGRAP